MKFPSDKECYIYGFRRYLDQSLLSGECFDQLLSQLCTELDMAYRAGWEAGSGREAPSLVELDKPYLKRSWLDQSVLRVISKMYEDLLEGEIEKQRGNKWGW